MNFRRGLLMICPFILCACEPQNLYVAHDTVLGINAKLNQGRQQGQLVVGYDRDFATVIPKSVDTVDGNGRPVKDVMSLMSCTELEVDGIYLDRYVDITASGEAAKRFAEEVGNGESFFNCNFSGDADGSNG